MELKWVHVWSSLCNCQVSCRVSEELLMGVSLQLVTFDPAAVFKSLAGNQEATGSIYDAWGPPKACEREGWRSAGIALGFLLIYPVHVCHCVHWLHRNTSLCLLAPDSLLSMSHCSISGLVAENFSSLNPGSYSRCVLEDVNSICFSISPGSCLYQYIWKKLESLLWLQCIVAFSPVSFHSTACLGNIVAIRQTCV